MPQFLNKIILWGLFLFHSVALVNAFGSVSLENNQDIKNFGEQIESSINNRNPRYVNLCFDGKALINNVTAKINTVQNPAFNEGFANGFLNSVDIGTYLVDRVLAGGKLKLIHAQGDGISATLLFRMISFEAIDYYEFSVEEIGKDFWITDFYIFSTGERLSENAYVLYKQKIASITLSDPVLDEYTQRMANAAWEGNNRKVLKYWKKLPEGIRYDKLHVSHALMAASKRNQKAFTKILDAFNTYYPDEPARYLIPLEGLIKHNLFEQALHEISLLEQAVYHDPVMDYLRANVYIKSGNTEQAIKCFDNLLKALPEFEIGYLSLLDVYLTKKEYSQAALLVKEMSISLNTSKEALIPYLNNYPDFVKSKAYHDWLSW